MKAKKSCSRRPRVLVKDVFFWTKISKKIGNEEEEKLFKEYGGIVKFINENLKNLIQDLKDQRVDLTGFTVEKAGNFAELFNNPYLDQEILEELNAELYGGDQRIRNFDRQNA